MRNTVRSSMLKQVDTEKNVAYVSSDKFFNDRDSLGVLDDMGFDVQPVDIFGGFVPQDKSEGNLEKNQVAIRRRFKLGE